MYAKLGKEDACSVRGHFTMENAFEILEKISVNVSARSRDLAVSARSRDLTVSVSARSRDHLSRSRLGLEKKVSTMDGTVQF